ncbi:P-loop containing nucleoside triphosphate hydrolase protein [Syncephalis fuscata]|nr:P-loop containing nucleoside triphosphate hydrolase protein [Syncephalis fuscata]
MVLIRPSLLSSLLSFSTVYAIMSFSMPFFMNLLLNYVSDPTSATPTMAMLYAVGMLVGSVVMSSTGQRAYWIGRRISVRIRAILSSELFIKSLRRRVVAKSKASTSAKAAAVVIDDVDTSTEEQQAEIIDHTKDEESKNDEESDDPADIGSITNLLSVDANSIGDISAHLHQMWVMPIQVVLSLVFLWKLLGASTIIGSLVIAPLFYISGLASSRYTSLQERLMKTTDKRLAASNEVLQGIRIIKLFAWEQQFRERVMIKRENELVNVWKQLVMLIYFTVLGFATPAIITLATFGAHTLLFGNTLTASTAFTSLALLNILHETMDQLPEAVAWTLQGYVSLNRISKFLDEPDIEYGISTDYRDINTVNSNEIGFENANNIIVGPTGAGKSSLLHALLGEMRCTSGKVLIPRRPLDNTIFSGSIDNVAYVAQQAWLQNLSIRDNILFGQEYEEDRYNQVVFACALKRDLEILDAGDSTEIGEKGVTLSGGQKQRVSLARAMYSSAKHILLDDCLSAHCLQGPLMQGRTRILVTHHVELCAHSANFIVTMQEGSGLLPELANSSVPPTRQPSPVSGTATPQNDSKIASGPQSSSETDISETDGEKAIVTKKKSSNGVSGKLTEEEERQQGSVGFSIYHTYIQASGGYGAWSVVILLYIISQTVIIMQTYWLRNWATSNETGGEDAKQYAGYYLSIYAGLGILAMATAVIRNMMLKSFTIARLLDRILYAKLRFFDVTPIGRIMNRFSKDIEMIDVEYRTHRYHESTILSPLGRESLVSWRTDTFGAFVSFFAAFFILYAPKSMDAGLAGFSLSFAVSFVDIMMWFIHLYANVEMNMNSIERVQEYLDIEQEAPAIIEIIALMNTLVIQYTPEHDPVIQDLSFSVQPGERVGIVGRTGADDVDISKIGLQDLRSHLTIIPQDPILFNGTIRSNVDPFSSYDDESIWNALRRKNGSNFSQGQRQLLAMARALLRTNKLIIMDEATASVDFDTDTKIQQTIREEFSQATLLCIAHRLRTIIDYDKVLVMDAGRMVEYDSPYSLIQKPDSLFRQLCERSGEFETLLELASAAKGAGSAKSIA